VDGKKVEGTGIERGVVFQQYALFPWLTVLQNVMFGLKLKGMPDAQAKEIAMKYIKMVQLEEFVHSYPKELSGGMKQRVAIARMLANSPEFLLMDEPFGALDPITKARLQVFLREIWRELRPTTVFVTHDIEEAVFLATKIYVLSSRPGRVKAEIPVNLTYKRTLDLKDTEEFYAYYQQIEKLIQEN